MPKSKSKTSNKKKIKHRDRSERSRLCEGCSQKLDQESFHYCVCTGVKFCSVSCQQENPHEDCPGPPKTKIDFAEKLKGDDDWKKIGSMSQKQENVETVQKPSMAYIMSKGVRVVHSDLTASAYAKHADEGDTLGNQACAYLAASLYKHRILSEPKLIRTRNRRGGGTGGPTIVADNSASDNIPVLESQELAFKYFEKAAKLGHGLSMQSLAECFHEGIGCKENHRRGKQWLWRSCLHHSSGAIDLLDSRALIPLEANATSKMLDQARTHLGPGQTMSNGGPNLASLLFVLHNVMKKENYSLPPFAGTWATATVNNEPTERDEATELRTPLIGSKAIKEAMQKVDVLNSRGNHVEFAYCRRGTCKAATSQTYSHDSRQIDCQLFIVPPSPACDESVTVDDCKRWREEVKNLEYKFDYHKFSSAALYPFCVHCEKKGEQSGELMCLECEEEAVERLDAVSRGSVILSLEEALPHRGQAAIYRNKSDGSLKMETWKTYGGGEAEVVLATLAANGISAYCSPLFIAQDPNFFWPLIADHGCIRAALEFVAPHIKWDEKIGVVKQKICKQAPVMYGSRPGKCFRKCGNDFCTNLENYKSTKFSSCGSCRRRRYCSKECQDADWVVHRRECKKARPPGNNEGLHLESIQGDDAQIVDYKHEPGIYPGDDVVVHGLIAKPEYNGMVGVVGEKLETGRISLTLRSEKKVLTIKPENIYCIGVFCRSRRKKSRVFECAHGLEVCTECYFDFSTVNRLAKFKYSGEDITISFVINQVSEAYFSSVKGDDKDGVFEGVEGWPAECFGMEQHLKQRFVLKALLKTKNDLSVCAVVARAAFVTYGGLKNLHLRTNAHLEVVARKL